MENLRGVRRYIAATSILWHLFAITFSLTAAYGTYTMLGAQIAVIVGTVLLVLSTILVGSITARAAAASTEFLARAILHVSSEQADAPAPKSSEVHGSREFMERLASYIYDMSSKGVMSNYPQAPLSPKNDKTPIATAPSTAMTGGLLQGIPLPTFCVDKNMQIISVSQSGLSFLNTDTDNVVGKKLYDVLRFMFSSEDTLDSWLNYLSEKAITGNRSWDRVKLVTPKEATKQVDMSARFSKDDPYGNELILVLFDQTDKYSQDDSGASFVSMAVHELRTPLTIMRGYIEVFEDELADKLDTEQSEFLRNLSVQAQQLGSFVSNIQNLARIESNSLELQLKQDNWAEVLGIALNDMDVRAKVRHKVIKRKIDENLPEVAIDRTTIYEVIVNIVENAIKYTHAEGDIIVSAHQKDENFVETTIQDHGVGIPDSLLGHVFDKFYRSHRSSKSVGGTGLGLYLSKTIIEAHGGEIWVKTKEGEGSTFGFTVPTYASIASEVNSSDNKAIERSAHGWIKNHTLYRG